MAVQNGINAFAPYPQYIYGAGNLAGSVTPSNAVRPKNDKLSIFYFNDLHGNTDYVGGLFAASKYFDSYSAKNQADTLKLSGGDNYSGSDKQKNKFIISLLNQLGVQYSAVGNHEFDSYADGFVKSAENSNIKFVSSNLEVENNDDLDKIITKSEIFKGKSGKTYGILGATTPDVRKVTITGAMKGIEVENFEGTIKELQSEIEKLKAQGVNKIILVSHIGYNNDKYLAKNLMGLDVIISGHSHDLIKDVKKGENLIAGRDGKPVVIVQAGENGKNYGILDLEFNQNGEIAKIKNSVENTIPANVPLIRHVEDSILGGADVAANIKYIDAMPKNRRIEPCAWTNFLADAMMAEYGADIAFINSANIRKTPDIGKLTLREIKESTPFDNTLLTTQMSEAEIIKALKFASKSLLSEDNVPGLLQVGGLRYEIDKFGNLLSVNFINKNGNSEPLNIYAPSNTKFFKVVYDSFLADGREYPPLDVKNKQVVQYNDRKDEAALRYLQKMPDNTRQNLVIKDDNRLVINAPLLQNIR